MALLSGKTISSSPMVINSAQSLETCQKQRIQEPKSKLYFEQTLSANKTSAFSMASGKPGIHGLDQHAMFLHPRSLNVNGNKIDKNEIPYESESSLCSSSMPGIQNKNCKHFTLPSSM